MDISVGLIAITLLLSGILCQVSVGGQKWDMVEFITASLIVFVLIWVVAFVIDFAFSLIAG
tara:strand:- start:288 stop:470 length:183 start_codon:yes stop_codon:yes gene_type:complete